MNATNDALFQQYKRLATAWTMPPSFAPDRPIFYFSVYPSGQLCNAKVFSSNGDIEVEQALLNKLKSQFPMHAFPAPWKGRFSMFMTQRDAKLIQGLKTAPDMSRLRVAECNKQEYRAKFNPELHRHLRYTCDASKAKTESISVRFFVDTRTGTVKIYEILALS